MCAKSFCVRRVRFCAGRPLRSCTWEETEGAQCAYAPEVRAPKRMSVCVECASAPCVRFAPACVSVACAYATRVRPCAVRAHVRNVIGMPVRVASRWPLRGPCERRVWAAPWLGICAGTCNARAHVRSANGCVCALRTLSAGVSTATLMPLGMEWSGPAPVPRECLPGAG